MASQTITTDLNWDSSALSALADGDGVTINGATLLQNSDSRFSFQGAVISGVTTDNSNGGRFLLDGTTVWWLPYTGGSGTIPERRAIDDNPVLVEQAATGASGELLAVFAELGVRETPPGGPLPASGFLKLRSTSDTFDASAITFLGCSATAAGPGQRGWLQAVLRETSFSAISASGCWQATGDWFELGITSGERGQSLRYYCDDHCPAIWIETAPGSDAYEVWSDCGTLRWEASTVTIPTDSRGKFFSCLVSGGTSTIRIAGSNCGTLPPAGCKVRVPNLHISAAPTADLSLNAAPNNTLNSRWGWSNTTGPVLLSHCNLGSVRLEFSQLWRVELAHCGWYNNLKLDRINSPLLVHDCANAVRDGGASANTVLELINNQVGGSISGCAFTRWSLSDNNSAVSLSGCSHFTVSDCTFRVHTLSENNAAQRNATWANPFKLDGVAATCFSNLKLLGGPIGIFGGSTGGNDLGGGVRLDAYLFVINGWRIQPQASSHRLLIEGNLFPEPITAPLFCPPPGNHLIQIERYVTTRAVVVSSTGTTTPGDGGPAAPAAELAEAIWSQELPGGNGLMAAETLIRAQQAADLAVALGL